MDKICLDVAFATRYGTKEAVVLAFFDYVLKTPFQFSEVNLFVRYFNDGDGQWWVKVAYADIGRELPFLNASTVRKLVPKLCEIGVLLRRVVGNDCFYRVDEVLLNEMFKKESEAL